MKPKKQLTGKDLLLDRQKRIEAGKIWQVYPDKETENILFEGSQSACRTFIKSNSVSRDYKKGKIRLAKIIFEIQP